MATTCQMKKNPVKKYMEVFNKPSTHKDKTKYSRKNKHKNGADGSLVG